ncbi:MAG: patatin-like phospholipase family protein [Dehalococcoidia bacterium]
MPKRALVLGGGGPVGVAWETGLAAGLEQEGVRLADADLIVGTSAGSIVGSQLALGRSPQDMLATQRELNEGDRPQLRAIRGPIDISGLIAQYVRFYRDGGPPEEFRKGIGAFALAAETMSEDEWLATFGSVRELQEWPEHPFVCTAIDTADGSLVTWDSDSGVELGLAVASSCAVPGIFPPITIAGRRYMDGGMGSTTNAGLARGYDKVLVVSVTGGVSSRVSAYPELAEKARARFAAELDAMRDAGSAVELIVPDEEAREAFGPNLMDPTRRREIAETGLRQGKIEAARIREWW